MVIAAGHSYGLLHSAVKTALLSPRYQCLFPSPYYREDGESSCEMGTISLDVTTHPSYQVIPSDGSVPPSALLWHFDPSILKHDLSVMLREAITRPLLCLRKELHDQVAWRVIVICLVCSPPAFLEMQSLSHIWFLAMGMGSVLGLCTAVVSSVLDILLEPMGWRISSGSAGHSYDLFHAAVKIALLLPLYQCLFPSPYYREDGENSCETGTISLDVTTHPSYQVIPSDGSEPPRALLWHYDPSILKHDLSEMLREAITRPLLCPRKELHDQVAWCVILICLVCSPPAFLEMRSMFHIWFLATWYLEAFSHLN